MLNAKQPASNGPFKVAPRLTMSADGGWLAVRDGVYGSYLSMVRMEDFCRTSYSYGRNHPVFDAKFSGGGRLWSLVDYRNIVFSRTPASFTSRIEDFVDPSGDAWHSRVVGGIRAGRP